MDFNGKFYKSFVEEDKFYTERMYQPKPESVEETVKSTSISNRLIDIIDDKEKWMR